MFQKYRKRIHVRVRIKVVVNSCVTIMGELVTAACVRRDSHGKITTLDVMVNRHLLVL